MSRLAQQLCEKYGIEKIIGGCKWRVIRAIDEALGKAADVASAYYSEELKFVDDPALEHKAYSDGAMGTAAKIEAAIKELQAE